MPLEIILSSRALMLLHVFGGWVGYELSDIQPWGGQTLVLARPYLHGVDSG